MEETTPKTDPLRGRAAPEIFFQSLVCAANGLLTLISHADAFLSVPQGKAVDAKHNTQTRMGHLQEVESVEGER